MATADSVAANRPFCAPVRINPAPISLPPWGATRIYFARNTRACQRFHRHTKSSSSDSTVLPFSLSLSILAIYYRRIFRVSLATQVLRKERINRRKLTVRKNIVFSGMFGKIRERSTREELIGRKWGRERFAIKSEA